MNRIYFATFRIGFSELPLSSFHDTHFLRSDKSRSGYLLLAIACVNYLMKYTKSGNTGNILKPLDSKFYIVITLTNCHSVRSNRSIWVFP